MNVNWTVRLKNPTFWVGIVGAIGTLVVTVASLFGVDVAGSVDSIEATAGSVITVLFSVLAALGVIADPTTKGVSDSAQALTYTAPKDDSAESADGDDA